MKKVALVTVLILVLISAASTLGLLFLEARGLGAGRADSAKISHNVDYVVRDANGEIRERGSVHNAINDPEALNEVFLRIMGGGSSQDYDEIGALAVARLADDPVNGDDPEDGVTEASISLSLDGSGAAGDQNPANGTVATDFATESGSGAVSVTFTATASTSVRQIVLTKNSDDRTDNNGAADIADSDIFAYVDVQDVTLNTDDSATYTWTLNVD